MTRYLLLYRAPVSATEQMASGSPEDAAAGMEAWMTWAGKAGDALVDLGQPVTTAEVVGVGGETGLPIGGYSIMEAESVDQLKDILHGHPHLDWGEGTIEILEFLPIPGA
jgi:hypothetical protein